MKNGYPRLLAERLRRAWGRWIAQNQVEKTTRQYGWIQHRFREAQESGLYTWLRSQRKENV